jgi:hypothetical protein
MKSAAQRSAKAKAYERIAIYVAIEGVGVVVVERYQSVVVQRS